MVREGIDRFLDAPHEYTKGRVCAVLAHAASCSRKLEHLLDGALRQGVEISRIFGPEHGLFGVAQDMEGVPHGEQYRGIPVTSLYGSSPDSLAPDPDLFRGVELLIVDLRDVGARYYTYVWTSLMTCQVALKVGVPVLLLDRVNPLGGRVEGNLLSSAYFSFVGYREVPTRHGLTHGELVTHCLTEEGIGGEALQVVQNEGWSRERLFSETGLPFVMPSPNMPTFATALVYPGMCLLEGTNLSEGRGTTRPFELFGAPYIDAEILTQALGEIPGVVLRPLKFKPTFQKWAGQVCTGAQLHVVDPVRFSSVAFALRLVQCVAEHWPRQFAFRTRAYEFVEEIPAYDLLTGDPRYRLAAKGELSFEKVLAENAVDQGAWFERVGGALLY